MRTHIWLQGSRIWVIVEFLCLIQIIKICAEGKWLIVAWKSSTSVKKAALQWRKWQYLVSALAEFICSGVHCHLHREVLSSTLVKCSGSMFMPPYQGKGGTGAESEGKRLQSMERKTREALVCRQGKAKRKAWRKMTRERLELTKEQTVCMAIRGAESPPRLTKQSQLKGIQPY